jgi:hypothetical protein
MESIFMIKEYAETPIQNCDAILLFPVVSETSRLETSIFLLGPL